MTAKRDRIPVSGPREILSHSPFAGLANRAPAVEESAAEPVQTPPSGKVPAAKPKWSVARTRKGGWPLRVEKRGGGKTVTILGSVSGDSDGLLQVLRKLCGTGGTLREGAIELQGDHVAKVSAFLDANR